MKKIKIIDLLIKIANNEEVPKKIKFGGVVWLYVGKNYIDKSLGFNYMDSNKRYLLGKFNFGILNDEVEIIDELKLYDIVKYCNYEWYVIKIEEEYVTLMSKNVIGTCTYSDSNSNDFIKSNCIKILNEFEKKLNINDLLLLDRNYDENKIYNGFIVIPTLREIEQMPMDVRNCNQSYWTMTSSYGVSENCGNARVFYVWSDGILYYGIVGSTFGVRPVIKIKRERIGG